MNPTSTLSYPNDAESIAQENARFMSKVYLWMTFGISLTGIIAYFVGNNAELVTTIVYNRGIFYTLIILQIAAVLGLSLLINKIGAFLASAIYLAYSALTGVTLSIIFLIYTQESIVHVFGITSFAFAGLSSFGYFTKRDLGPVGSFCMMGLFGLIGFGLLSIFMPSIMTESASKIYAIVGIIVFSGLTAYDTQKIKNTNIIGNEGTAEDHKEAVFGALTLYLDFINLFLKLLRLLGKRR